MSLTHVAAGDPHVKAHNDERDAINVLQGQLGTGGGSGSGTGTGVNVDDVGYDLVVLMGQSNMVGLSGSAAQPDTLDSRDSRVFVFEDDKGPTPGQIRIATDPLYHQLDNPGFLVGPGLNLGRFYAQSIPTNRKVLLIPAAVSGTNMIGGTAPWNHAGPSGSSNLPQGVVTRVTNALKVAGPNARVAAFMWHQGESDGLTKQTTAAYKAALADLIDWMRANVPTATSTTPFVVGGLCPDAISQYLIDSNGYTYRDVDAALRQVAGSRLYTQYALAPVNEYNHDGNHFAAKGARDLGENMGRAVVAARKVSSLAAQTFPTRPAKATGIAAANIQSSQMDINGTAIAGADGYFINYAPSGSGAAVVVYTKSFPATIKGLSPNTAYAYRVSAVNAGGVGDPSDVITASTIGSSNANNVVDNFQRADSFTIGAGSSGPAPTVVQGQGFAVQIKSNLLQLGDSSGHEGKLTWDIAATDLDFEVDMATVTEVSLLFRYQDETNTYLVGNNGNFYAIEAGTYRYIDNLGSFTSNDVVVIGVHGSTFTLKKNDTVIGTKTDTTYTNGKVGIRTANTISTYSGVKVTAA